MTYVQSGLIQPTDYNGIIGTSPSSTANLINTVWSTGNGAIGYGQTALSQVSSTGVVTATQWATLINTLNSIRTHQSGAGTGITATTAGNTINFLSTLVANANIAYTNALTFSSNAAVITGANIVTPWVSLTSGTTETLNIGTRITFGNADQTRYFFNAGGRLKYNVVGSRNGSTSSRTDAIVALCTDLGGVALFGSNTNAGRTGTGGTLNSNVTTLGYYTSTYNSNTTVISVTSTTASYTSDTATIAVSTSGTTGLNNDNGPNVDFWLTLNSTSGAGTLGGTSANDDIGANISIKVDVSYPETTNLSNTWGAATISSIGNTVNYLVGGGGGAGGSTGPGGNGGGGGGAGGVKEGVLSITQGTVYTVSIGAGGAVVAYNSGTWGNGSPSTFGPITANGGGGGGPGITGVFAGNAAPFGGSGGGAGSYSTPTYGGLGLLGQGFAGGNVAVWAGRDMGGGGGGAAGQGFSAISDSQYYRGVGGYGGPPMQSNITGTSTYYAGGGGAGGYYTNSVSYAPGGSGLGSGGNGGYAAGAGAAGAGATNTGGGGGGGSGVSMSGATGGSGVVIFSYANTAPNVASITGLTYTMSFSGQQRIFKFTAGTGSVTF